MVVLASAGGNTVPAIARLVQAAEDTIRQVIHRFNEMGMASLDPQWAGGRPRQVSHDEEASSSRRPTPAPKLWGGRSPAGAYASSLTTSPRTLRAQS
jgi:transposase